MGVGGLHSTTNMTRIHLDFKLCKSELSYVEPSERSSKQANNYATDLLEVWQAVFSAEIGATRVDVVHQIVSLHVKRLRAYV